MPLTPDRMTHVCDRLGGSKVLILGDIMIDEYLLGSVERISPEAPVPVVEVASSRTQLGGSANVAANIKSLNDDPILLGVVGEDEAAQTLGGLLERRSISCEFLVSDKSRPTTIKTRLMAHSQQVVRFDREKRHKLNGKTEKAVLDRVENVLSEIKAVIISDYGKGVISASLLDRVTEMCNSRDIFIAVDPKETNFHNYRNVSLITPNHHEAGFAFGQKIQTESDLYDVGTGLLDKLKAKSILITRGAEGMSLFSVGNDPTHIPTFARQVFDVTGAGDTVIATFVAATNAGATLSEAAVFANAGAGVTVAEVGTATVTKDQLRRELVRNIKNGRLQSAVKN